MRNALNVPDPLLVSCPNGGGLALLDGDLCLPLSHVDCTGLAIGRNSVLWCLQEDGARALRELHDGQLRTIGLSDDPMDLHDVAIDNRDVYVVSTQTNEVLRLDRKYAVQERWSLGGEPDSSHVNCVAVCEDRLLASIFGRFETHRGYKGNTRGAGEIIDVRSGKTLVGGLSQPHSIACEGSLLYVCSSEDKELVVYDGFRQVRTIALPGYTRGLALGAKHVYVGLSCSRNLEIESQTGYFETGAVAILRKDDMALVGTVQVPWKEVYDIRIASDRPLLQSLLAACWERERSTAKSGAEEELVQLRDELRDVRTTAARNYASLEQSGSAKLQDALRQGEEARASLVRTEARAKSLEQQVAALKEQIQKRNERLMRVRVSHAEVGSLAIRRQHELEASEKRIAEARSQLIDRDARIVALRTSVQERDERIVTLRTTVQERDERIAGLGQAVHERNERAASLAERLREAHRRIDVVTGLIGLRDGRVGELEASLARALESDARHRNRVADLSTRVTTLEEAARELDMVKQSRSWRLTRPLRFAMRLLRNRGLAGSDRDRVRAWLGLPAKTPAVTPASIAPAPVPASAPIAAGEPLAQEAKAGGQGRTQAPWRLRKSSAEVRLVAQPEGAEDVYVWGVIDWHFRIQRPQHLARELAASGRRVFYVSNNFIDVSEPGFKVEPLDEGGHLFQVFLNVPGKPVIYFDPPDAQVQAQLAASLRELLAWTRSRGTVSLVQHPYWSGLAKALPNHKLVYDCMDHHGGFENNGSRILALEEQLMRDADLLVVSSVWLDEEGAKFNGNRALIRNAGQYEHFSERPEKVFSDPQGRRVIGYYGAIAPWFDLDLVDRVATENPDCLVLLVGADTCGARARLGDRPNVSFTGEVPYDELPFYLYGFDVCMLPFKVLPLTLATNPVKAYEYLSAGKPVVTVDLPEMHQFGDLVRRTADADGFIDEIRRALDEAEDDHLRQRRREFASGQTWAHRAGVLVEAFEAIPEPRVSIVVLTYNNLELTKACLESIEAHSDYRNMEVIVVDNASTDGSQDYLREWASGPGDRRLIANSENRGFAAGNNLGLEAADGDYLVLLNNDTQVTPGWLRTMIAHFRKDRSIGILGPVTNNIGNEARIETDYADDAGMLATASDYTLRHAGCSMDMRTVAFFCAMLPRHAYERIGGLDESFGVGFFEDDDYCRRVEAAGLRVVCAEDVFVHHHLSASFNKLAGEKRKELFERNKAIYEAKWGEWEPHRYRGRGGA